MPEPISCSGSLLDERQDVVDPSAGLAAVEAAVGIARHQYAQPPVGKKPCDCSWLKQPSANCLRWLLH